MKIFSFDVETNGLYGQGFAIAAVVTDSDGLVAQFLARCPIVDSVNEWVAQNVLPQMTDIEVTHNSYSEMLEAFFGFYVQNKKDSVVIAHMAFPVEAKFLRDMIELDLGNRQWEGPFPLIDVAGTLDARGFDPTSVDTYNKNNGLVVPFNGSTHNPLFDAWSAEVCYRHLKSS